MDIADVNSQISLTKKTSLTGSTDIGSFFPMNLFNMVNNALKNIQNYLIKDFVP